MTDQRRLNATTAALNQHVKELTAHTLDVSDYNAHGHAAGRQGAAGHTMPPNDAHRQDGAYIPQNMYSDGAGSAEANDASTSDYGTVDNKP